MTGRNFKKAVKLMFEEVNRFLLDEEINNWNNFPRVNEENDDRDARAKSGIFEPELKPFIFENKSALLARVNRALCEGNIDAELIDMLPPEENGKNKISFYDIEYLLKSSGQRIPVIVNIKYWDYEGKSNNIGGSKNMAAFIISNEKKDSYPKHGIEKLLEKCNYYQLGDPYPKDYFLHVFYKPSERDGRPIKTIHFGSIFDLAENITVNQSQGPPGLQFKKSGRDGEFIYTLEHDEKTNKVQILNWIREWSKPRPYHDKLSEFLDEG